MRLSERFWAAVTYTVNLLTFSPDAQYPLDWPSSHFIPPSDVTGVVSNQVAIDYPIFKPPGGRISGDGSDFVCNYSAMVDWEDCSSTSNRGCWLRHPDGRDFSIHTNYEDFAPQGIDRYYTLVVNDFAGGPPNSNWGLNLDGLNATGVKLFNGTYPGPWIQACWGDVSPFPMPLQ